MRRRVDAIVRGTAGATVAWIALAQTAAWWWPGELAAHWTLHAAFALIALAIVLKRRRRWAAACALAFPFALWPWLLGAFEPRAAPVDAPRAQQGAMRRVLTVAHGNLLFTSPHHAAAIAALAAGGPDVLSLVEAVEADRTAFAGDSRWPYQRWLLDARCGNALLSRHPIVSVVDHWWGGMPAIDAVIAVDGAPLHVVVIHPRAPMSPAMLGDRQRCFAALAEVVAAGPLPTLVVGDWNCTVGTPRWRALRIAAGIARPRGEPATWPSPLGAFGIAIDRFAGSDGVAIDPPKAVWLTGSDHRGIVTRVAFANRSR